MFSEIAEIKSIREQKSKLSEREKELTEPILTDLDMIGMLYRWFQEIISQKEIFRSGNVTQRKKFIFIILFLYSPSTLAGGKMKNGLRDKLAEVLGVNAQTITVITWFSLTSCTSISGKMWIGYMGR
jgi:hypothetical protein